MTPAQFMASKMGAAITVRLSQGDENALVDILEDGTILIQLACPPESSQANRKVSQFLSELLKIPPSSLEIIAGQSRRDKLLAISGLNPEAVQAVILKGLDLTQAELDRRRQRGAADRQ